eukprot:CAMPEP_0194443156 /NCGR_PEP_ID=MMETSP0176-20130528/126546_1 /TAXON_ID=216777 /ORGANISM="Proboscia alata, Strain PI-D3" /LENGTH=466 /DNA_ID=CAMNT_0039269365 /DNA_START=60 /DNA_END=1460 /DNA_ORIENTATION=-
MGYTNEPTCVQSVATAPDRDHQCLKATILSNDDESSCSIHTNEALNELLGLEFGSGLITADEEDASFASPSVPVEDASCVSTTSIPTDDVSACSIDTNEALNELLGLDFGSGLIIADEDDDDTAPSSPSPLPVIVNSNIQRIALPPNASRHGYPSPSCLAVTMDNILSPSECQDIIQTASLASQSFQYITEAVHTAPDGSSHLVELQNPNPHKLSVFENPVVLSALWSRLEDPVRSAIRAHNHNSVRNHLNTADLRGLNPRLRVLKYDASDQDQFKPHYDATTTVGDGGGGELQSLLTVLVYLNNGACKAEFSGGETLFLDSKACTSGIVDTDASVSVVPTAGKVVVFEHDLYHASSLLEWGTKYVLRTDVLFDVASDTPVTNRETNGSEPKAEIRKEETNMTIVELCHQLQFSSDETEVLDSLGILDVTIESFCAPGVTMLRLMMDGIRTEKINALIQSAFELLK